MNKITRNALSYQPRYVNHFNNLINPANPSSRSALVPKKTNINVRLNMNPNAASISFFFFLTLLHFPQ